MSSVKITGERDVLKNISDQIERMDKVTMKGLLEAGLLVQGVAQGRTPVDTGNLKGTAYTRKAQNGDLSVEVGYTADYALVVHEDMEAHHENGQAKFLTSTLHDEESRVLNIISRNAEVE